MRGAAALGGAALAALSLAALGRGGDGVRLSAGEPVTLGGGAGNPTAALAADGSGWVAWTASTDGVSNVLAARLAPGGKRGPAMRVNDLDGDAAPHEQAPPRIAAGPGGHLYVVWQNNTRVEGRRFPASDLRFARSVDGGRSFEPARTVNDDAGGTPSSHTFHDLLVAPDGTVWVSWIDSRMRDAARTASGGGAHHAHGDLPPSEIRVARSVDGGRSFEASLVVDSGPCPCCRTAMAAGEDGTLYVAWRKEFAGSVRDVVVARLAPGAAAFAPPVRVHEDGWEFPACPHAGPALAVDGTGRLHAGWYTGREGRQGLWLARSEDGARSFGAPVALRTGVDVPPGAVTLAAVRGSIVAAWDTRAAEGAAVALGMVGRDGRVRRMGARYEGRLPVLASAGGRALLAWHAGESVRAVRLSDR
jgi:hypothetical protein